MCLGLDAKPKKQEEQETLMTRGMGRLHISEGELNQRCMVHPATGRDGSRDTYRARPQPVAVIRSAEPVRRKISERIALMSADSTASIDPQFCERCRCGCRRSARATRLC